MTAAGVSARLMVVATWFVGACVFAAGEPSPAGVAPQRVEVFGARGIDDGGPTMRHIVRRAEIERFGDTQLSDVLRRVNGVTVTTTTGKPPEVRLRGLGNGYARVLINGEAPPAGFSIDTIAPSQIERIEIVRAVTADTSAEAIAGTINIVLAGVSSSVERSVQLGAGVQGNSPSATADFRWSDRTDELRRSLTGAIQSDPMDSRWQGVEQSSGSVTGSERLTHASEGTSHTVNLAGGVQRKAEDSWSWRWENSVRYRAIDEEEVESAFDTLTAASKATYQDSLLRTTSLQSKVRLEREFSGGAKIDFGLSLSAHERSVHGSTLLTDGAGTELLSRFVRAKARTWTPIFDGKYRLAWVPNHDIVVGWQFDEAGRSESQFLRERAIGEVEEMSDASFESQVSHRAVFVQDEYIFDKATSAYLGLRGEVVSSRTAGATLGSVEQLQTLVSPVLQASSRLPGPDQRLVRVALTRTYKVPNPRDLIPLTWRAADNDPLSPDEAGNPALRPEKAWGVDVGYSQRLGDAGQISVTAFSRRIDDVTIRQTSLQDGRWLERKENGGGALAWGIECEASVDLQKMLPNLPALQLTGYLAVNESRLLDVAEGSRRMDQQAPVLAKLGWERSLAGTGWRWGGQVLLEKGSVVRYSDTTTRSTGDRTTVDLFASWTPSKEHSVRVAVTNGLGASKTESAEADLIDGRFERWRRYKLDTGAKVTWRTLF